MPVWPEQPEREDGPPSSCRPLRSYKKARTMENEIKFGFLKDLPSTVWGVEIAGRRQEQ